VPIFDTGVFGVFSECGTFTACRQTHTYALDRENNDEENELYGITGDAGRLFAGSDY
jgi:hypothetical protein